MIPSIQPQSNFPISWLLPDLFDSTTYYVQAVVRDAVTDDVLATINLPYLGNRIYSSIYRTPTDPSGQGRFITITVTVYTDSGYTMPSTKYSAELQLNLIYDQFHFVQSLASQISAITTADVDYRRIEKLVRTVIGDIKYPEYAPMDHRSELDQIHKRLQGVETKVGGIKIPEMAEYPKTDLSPVIEGIKSLHAHVKKHIEALPKPQEVDLEPLSKKIESFDMEGVSKTVKETSDIAHNVASRVEGSLTKLEAALVKVVSDFKDFLYTAAQSQKRPKEQADEIISFDART